jgi:hypothetical protein
MTCFASSYRCHVELGVGLAQSLATNDSDLVLCSSVHDVILLTLTARLERQLRVPVKLMAWSLHCVMR